MNLMGPLDYLRALAKGTDDDPLGVQPYDTYEDGSSDPPPPAPAAYQPVGLPLSGLFGSGDESVRVPAPPPPTPNEAARMGLMQAIDPNQPLTRPVG